LFYFNRLEHFWPPCSVVAFMQPIQ